MRGQRILLHMVSEIRVQIWEEQEIASADVGYQDGSYRHSSRNTPCKVRKVTKFSFPTHYTDPLRRDRHNTRIIGWPVIIDERHKDICVMPRKYPLELYPRSKCVSPPAHQTLLQLHISTPRNMSGQPSLLVLPLDQRLVIEYARSSF